MKARLGAFAASLASFVAVLGCRATSSTPELPFALVLEFEFAGQGAGEQSGDEERLTEIVHEELARLEVVELDKAAVDDAAFALELFYRGRGHADVRVEYELVSGADEPRARFRITEGSVVRVRELVLEGAEAIAPEHVRTYLEPAASGGIYDERRLAAGLDALREAYRELGYLRIAIDEPEVAFDDGRTTVTLRVVLREGPAFRVRALDFQGGVAVLAQREAELARQHSDKLYLPMVLPEIEHALIEAYRRSGHPDVVVRVRPELDETSGDARIMVQITPGERVTIAGFRIDGKTRTHEEAILSFMRLERGEVYDSERVREAFRALYATGLFESVSLELEGNGPERTLVVRLAEARSVEIRVEPGYGSYEGPRLLLGIEEKNFQGRGQVLELAGTVSTRAQGARIAWVDRDLFGSQFTSETTFFVEQREEPSFEFVRRGFGFFVRRSWNEDWSSSTGYEFRPTNVTDDSLSMALPQDFDSDPVVAALSAILSVDDRDNPLAPTRGRHGRARFDWADDGFGSDTEFLRAQVEYTHLLRVWQEGVLAASARTGVIAPFGGTDEIPLPERFFNGGESSVRSFKEDELLSPGASGEPLGGETATTLNLELRHPLTGNLTGALFFDAGNVTAVVQDYLRFDGFRSGIGVGLRYLLPIGPVRLDLGVNPDPGDDEDELVLHVSVGFPF